MTTRIRRYLPALMLAAGVITTSAACATYGYGRYGYDGYSQPFGRRAYDYGYRAGRSHGRDDARHRREYSYWRTGDYRDANDGFRRGDGDRDAYRDSYRRGFEAGYGEAFNQNGVTAPRGRR